MKLKLCAFSFVFYSQADHQPIELNSKIIHALDGITRIIDGNTIKTQYTILSETANLQFGKINEYKKREGFLGFGNGKKNIKQLVIEETKLENELKAFNLTPKDVFNAKALPNLPQNLIETINGLNAAFMEAKEYFKHATFPFIDQVKHFKHLVVQLMEDWSKKRNRPDSIILRWAETAGNEEEVYHKHLTTLKIFDIFLNDLNSFLRDLIYNCPKAKKQFEEWYLKK